MHDHFQKLLSINRILKGADQLDHNIGLYLSESYVIRGTKMKVSDKFMCV